MRQHDLFTAIMLGLLVFALGRMPYAGADEAVTPPDNSVMQRQIDELKQKLADMDELKARLTALEDQFKGTQTAQKKTEEARAKEAKERKITGYMQLRYRGDNAPDGKKEFLVRRVRTNVQGDLSPKTAYRIELQSDAKEKGLGTGSKVQLRTAYIDQKLSQACRLRFGQTVIPFGYELETSVPALWTGERAFFMDRLFPDQRDIGADFQWVKDKQSPIVNLGLFNGTLINTSENNSSIDPMARVTIPFSIGNYDNGSVAISYYDGRNGEGPSATDRIRLGGGAEGSYGPWAFMGEYVTGKDLGADMRGWYAQLGRKIGKTPGTIFAKYDTYDENTNVSGNEFNRWDAGYFYDFDARTRLTLVYELRDVGQGFSERSKWDGNAAYLQLQVKY